MKYIGIGSADLDEKEVEYATMVLRSKIISPAGFTKKLEEELGYKLERDYVILCNSGQSALEIALLAIRELHPNIRRIACPTLTYISTLAAIMHAGLEPYFIDIHPHAYNIDWDIVVREKDNFDALLPVSLFGLSSFPSIDVINQLIGKPIIVDNCESLFAHESEYGDISCGSFYTSHSLSLGNGGVIATDNKELMQICRSLINHGLSNYNFLEFDKLTFERNVYKFTFDRWGKSYKFNDVLAAIGLAQLEKWNHFLEKRIYNAWFYTTNLRPLEVNNKIQLPLFKKNVFMMYPLVMIEEDAMDIQRELADNNIETRPMMPLTNQPIFKETFGDIAENYPVSNHINSHGFYVGCHTMLTQEDLEKVVETISGFFEKREV